MEGNYVYLPYPWIDGECSILSFILINPISILKHTLRYAVIRIEIVVVVIIIIVWIDKNIVIIVNCCFFHDSSACRGMCCCNFFIITGLISKMIVGFIKAKMEVTVWYWRINNNPMEKENRNY